MKTQLAIVGAGPAGLCAAIAAKEADPDCGVLLLDRMQRAGNKIYATGNGRCNLTNLHQAPEDYFSDSAEDPFSYLGGIGDREVCAFVEDLGVRLYDRDGYVYPKTNQASSIALPLVHRAEDLGAKILTGSRVTGIQRDGRTFLLRAKEEQKGGESLEIHATCLLLSCGGLVSRSFGDEGDGAKLAASLGHRIIPLFPALTYLATSAPGMKVLAGVRANGACALYADGKLIRKSEGEIQFTEGALSGIPFFQLSHAAGRALAAGKKVEASVCFLPGEKLSPEALL
ncbi:MAG: NAD(P)/FAD-dependent oxidoreductase, partial [Lachnospiraceae bacterium]